MEKALKTRLVKRMKRRPGLLGNTNYWFGNVEQGMVAKKLEEIRLANIANSTPLTNGQRTQRIHDHLKNQRRLMS